MITDDQRQETEVDEWWLQQQTNACAEQRPNFAPISDVWPFRPRFDRFTRGLRYKGPFLKVSKRRRADDGELLGELLEQEQTEQQQQEIKKEPSPTPSVTTSVETEDDGNSTDMEEEIQQAQTGNYLRTSHEGEIEAQIRKYTGPINVADKDTKNLLRSYVVACNKMKVPVLRAVVKAIALNAVTIVDIRHCSTSYESMQPLTAVLERNERITTLILEDCGLGLSNQGGDLVASIIEKNPHLRNLNLGSNFLGPRAVPVIANALERNRTLEYINLSRNQFVDVSCGRLIEAIGSVNAINVLDISGNEIGQATSLVLTDWLLQTDCKLKVLNLGWSTIRLQTASSICSALRLNWSLRMIDLSYNGLALEGATVLGEALRTNNRLKNIDLSGNRFRNEAAKMIAEGLTKNVGLHSLCLKDNPIGIEGILSIMTALQRNKGSALRVFDISGIAVSPKIVQIAEIIKTRVQNEPMKASTQQALLQHQILQEKFGLGSAVLMKDFEFTHGPIIALEGHSFFEVPQKGLESVVAHRFSDELQKHCPNIRLIDIFRSCAPQGDQGVTIPQFIRGFMKQITMTEDELRHTAIGLDPEAAMTNFVNFNTFSNNFKALRRSYFGDDANSHRLRWVAKYHPLVAGIAESTFLSAYNNPRLESIKPNLLELKIIQQKRLRGMHVASIQLPPINKSLQNIERKELLTKGTWLVRPEKFEKNIEHGLLPDHHPALHAARQLRHHNKLPSKLDFTPKTSVPHLPPIQFFSSVRLFQLVKEKNELTKSQNQQRKSVTIALK